MERVETKADRVAAARSALRQAVVSMVKAGQDRHGRAPRNSRAPKDRSERR